MADYQCIYCSDRGNCNNCSWFFEPDEIHAKCGFRWADHISFNHTSWHDCPKETK